jgi:dolichol-phosphate mannosyltransferase
MPSAPAISIVVPVYNEEAAIGGLLDNLGAQTFTEVVVVDGGSTDRTAELASKGPVWSDVSLGAPRG